MKNLRTLARRPVYFCSLLLSMPMLVAGATLDLKSGATFDFIITAGSAPYRSFGHYRFAILDPGTSYRIFSVSDVFDSSGTMTYTRLGENGHEILYNDSIDGIGFSQKLTYSRANQGSYNLTNPRFTGTQSGNFVLYEGSAPTVFNRKILTLTISGGTAPFVQSGSQRFIATSPGVYLLEKSPGVANSSGTFTYAKVNRSSGQLSFNDSARGTGFNLLTFATARSGIFLVRGDGGGHQTGSFTLDDFVPVSITSPPASRAVLLGDQVTFKATVVGTGPVFYQWQKNGGNISGATATQYTIPFVQSSDAGDYRLVARNAAGSVASAVATLTPVCNYVLTPTTESHPDAGGEGSIVISGASQECPWAVSNENSWITLTSASSGTGVGSVTYSVAPNTTDAARLGYLTVGSRTFVVTQSARRAPPSLEGKIALLNPANSEDSIRIVFTSSHLHQLNSPSENFPTDKGSYTYSRNDANVGVIAYMEADESRELSLSFDTHQTGLYILSNSSGTLAEGTFILSASGPDFNFDTYPDFLFQNTAGTLAAWFMKSTDYLGSGYLRNGLKAAPGWRALGAADFNSDGLTDVLFQHNTGTVAVWYLDRTNLIGSALVHNGTRVAAGWRVAGVTDFNHDGKPDVIFQHESRRVMVWYLNGVSFIGSQLIRNGIPAVAGWQMAGLGDFNDDGQTDLLWRHTDRSLAAWHLVGTTLVSAVVIARPTAEWRITGGHDFNEDGEGDFLFRHNDGRLAIWFMDKTTRIGTAVLRNGSRVNPVWSLAAPR